MGFLAKLLVFLLGLIVIIVAMSYGMDVNGSSGPWTSLGGWILFFAIAIILFVGIYKVKNKVWLVVSVCMGLASMPMILIGYKDPLDKRCKALEYYHADTPDLGCSIGMQSYYGFDLTEICLSSGYSKKDFSCE